jgi:hypothetical protein
MKLKFQYEIVEVGCIHRSKYKIPFGGFTEMS